VCDKTVSQSQSASRCDGKSQLKMKLLSLDIFFVSWNAQALLLLFCCFLQFKQAGKQVKKTSKKKSKRKRRNRVKTVKEQEDNSS